MIFLFFIFVSFSQTELSRQEQSMAESRKEREVVLSEYRKQADEKKEFAEKVERRVSVKIKYGVHKNSLIFFLNTQLRRASTTHSIAHCKYHLIHVVYKILLSIHHSPLIICHWVTELA